MSTPLEAFLETLFHVGVLTKEVAHELQPLASLLNPNEQRRNIKIIKTSAWTMTFNHFGEISNCANMIKDLHVCEEWCI